MRTRTLIAATVAAVLGGVLHAAPVVYPLALRLDAQVKVGAATVNSALDIRVDEAMPAFRRTKALDGFKHGGYPGFLSALRAMPAIGTVATQNRSVELRYVHEEQTERGRRLLLVADRPLFFLNQNQDKPRAGYELTMVELFFDDAGGVTGTMTGAARVKPTPDWSGGVILDEYEQGQVQLQGRVTAQKK